MDLLKGDDSISLAIKHIYGLFIAKLVFFFLPFSIIKEGDDELWNDLRSHLRKTKISMWGLFIYFYKVWFFGQIEREVRPANVQWTIHSHSVLALDMALSLTNAPFLFHSVIPFKYRLTRLGPQVRPYEMIIAACKFLIIVEMTSVHEWIKERLWLKQPYCIWETVA